MTTSSETRHACALHFAELVYRVFAGVRSAAAGESVRAGSPLLVTPILLDVTQSESIAGAVSASGGTPLGGLVNNAGIAITGPLELVPRMHCGWNSPGQACPSL